MGFLSKFTSFIASIFTKGNKNESFTQSIEDEILNTDDYTDDYVEQEEIYIQHIRHLISQVALTFPHAGDWFTNIVDEQIEKYGAKAVAEGLDSVSPRELEDLIQIAFYAPEHVDGQSALIKLWSMVTSEIPTQDDLAHMEDLVYSEESWKMYEDWTKDL